MKTFIGVYIIAIFCFLSTSAGPSFLISYVSVLAAVMALNTIASDDMDNGMPYIFTFPISRKEYVKEKYLLGAGMVTVLWAVAVAIAIGVNASGYHMVSWEELIASAAAGLFLAVFVNAVVFPVQLKYGSSTGRLVLLILVFGIMAVGWIGVELCQKMNVDFSGLKNLGLRIWNLGIPVCLAMLFVLMLLMLLISCTISLKIWRKRSTDPEMKKNQIFIKCGTEYKEMTKELLEACDLAGEIEKKFEKCGLKVLSENSGAGLQQNSEKVITEAKFETKSSLIDNSEAEVDCFYSSDSVEKQNSEFGLYNIRIGIKQTWSPPWKPTGAAPPIRR